MTVPRCKVQGRIPGRVLASQDILLAVLGQIYKDCHGAGVPCPRRAVQRRVQCRVPSKEETIVPDEPMVEFLDHLAMPFLRCDMKNGVPLPCHLK